MNRYDELCGSRPEVAKASPIKAPWALLHTPVSSAAPVPTGNLAPLPELTRSLDVSEMLTSASNLDAIPLPSLVPPGVGSVFQSESERLLAGQSLDALNKEALANPNSELVQKSLYELSSMLNAPTGIEYQFKSSGSAGGLSNPMKQVPAEALDRLGLGRFEQLVLDKTRVAFKVANPPTPQPSYSMAHGSLGSAANYSVTHDKPGGRSALFPQNVDGPSKSSAPLPDIPGSRESSFRGPAQQTPGSLKSPIGSQTANAVKIPSLPETFDRSQYTKHTDVDKRVLKKPTWQSSDQRKWIRSDPRQGRVLVSGLDAGVKASALLERLQDIISSILISENNPDSPGDNGEIYWVATEPPCLANSIHIKLEDAIHSVITNRRFKDVCLDDLVSIQRICINSLKRAEYVTVMVADYDNDEAVGEWLERVAVVDNGLKTAKTAIRIMLGDREEKQIYPEDLLASILNLAKNLVEDVIIRMIEMRPTEEQLAIFRTAFAFKEIITGILHELTSVLSLVGELITKEEVSERAITTLEFIATPVIFVENASAEKDSAIDIQKVERFRVTVMDILVKIFARYPDQRVFIFDEILTSVEKLSINRQSARQFKLPGSGKNIQLVSALIIRLVQISGTRQDQRRKPRLVLEGDDGVSYNADGYTGHDTNHPDPVNALRTVSDPLLQSARKSALYVVNYLVRRAMTSTKTGDQPYRILMDIFTEDLLAVIRFPEWPGAELLLQCILSNVIHIITGDKQTAPAKSLAVDLLGLMGSGICGVVAYLREIHKNAIKGDARIDHIHSLTEGYLSNGYMPSTEGEIIKWHGPYRYSLAYLSDLVADDASLQSSREFYLMAWSAKVSAFSQRMEGSDLETEEVVNEVLRTAAKLERTMTDSDWTEDLLIESVPLSLLKEAYVLTVLHMPFCGLFENILEYLLRSLGDNQATTRSKALKSIFQLIQRDPSILDRHQVLAAILKPLNDPSPLVRDSVVDLIGKCIPLQPSLELRVYHSIISRSMDATAGVRRRSMKILKEIYMRNDKVDVKVAIAEALLKRIKDSESAVSELARKAFEDIWVSPFYRFMGVDEALVTEWPEQITSQIRLHMNQRVSVIVRVVQKPAMQNVLHDMIKSILHVDAKNTELNFKVCKSMVWLMCDTLLGEQGDGDKANRARTLRALTVFAKANPNLFTPEQLVMFRTYTENLSSPDDLLVFRSVVTIFRCALPALSSVHSELLHTVQETLLSSINTLPSTELPEVISCIWAIGSIIKNTGRISRVTISCLTNILNSKETPIETDKQAKRLFRLLHILGLLGKHCRFQEHAESFKAAFPDCKHPLVSEFITDVIASFCAESTHPYVRKSALQSLCQVCEAHASHFLKPAVLKVFDDIFLTANAELINLVLAGIKDFLLVEEHRSDEFHGEEETDKDGGVERLSRAANVNQNDGVSTSLAQRYLERIMNVATSSQNSYALTAAQVIGSILRQGLVHPKELVPTLVALETSTNSAIRTLACREFQTLHSKHESIVERGYMEGIRSCFHYQRDVIGDKSGFLKSTFASKLEPLYETVKTSRKGRKNFLENMTMSLDFDPERQDVHSALDYSIFVIENLASFNYGSLDELHHVMATIERLVRGTGVRVAHMIETEILFIGSRDNQVQTIDPDVLKTLSAGAAILTLLWECKRFLRKYYGINESKRGPKTSKLSAKDANKTPSKAPTWADDARAFGISVRDTKHGLKSTEGKMKQCSDFSDWLNVDDEFKLSVEGADSDDTEAERAATPDRDYDHDMGVEGGVGGAEPMTPVSKKRKGNQDTPGKGSGRPRKEANQKTPKFVVRK